MRPESVHGRRVLCVTPRFAPANAADTHRLRLLLPHLAAAGWSLEVLTVDSRDAGVPCDPWLSEALPPRVPIHRVRGWPLRGWGLRGLAQRAFVPLLAKGNALLRGQRFDLVFFTTTEFLLHALGPLWKRRWGVPFCMDLQDPWVNDYYREHPEATPPGGRLKHAIADRIHRVAEACVVPRCDGFMAVTAPYLDDLARRHGRALALRPRLVAPFPAEPAEFEGLQPRPEPAAGRPARWRYIGRGGPDMAVAAKAFFRAWRDAIDGRLVAPDGVRFEADGTSYAAAGTGEKTLEPLAAEAGLAGLVTERPDRLPYRRMLQQLLDSQALVVFGSDDPRYTASKVYPYLLARRPLLLIVHEASPLVGLVRSVGGAVCVTFRGGAIPDELAAAVRRAWFDGGQHSRTVPLDEAAFERYTAKSQSEDVGQWWISCMEQHSRRGAS